MGLLRRHNWRRQPIAPLVYAVLALTVLFLAALFLTSSNAGTPTAAAPIPLSRHPQTMLARPRGRDSIMHKEHLSDANSPI